uniref:ShKT domain-containing protein n=1 Tax=Parascaris equorum TaxID=6256 RepID=A0A914RTM9_PAREQ
MKIRQCEDTIPNCQIYLAHCNNPLYDKILREKCGKTCNKCISTATTTGTCVDDMRLVSTELQFLQENGQLRMRIKC